jgi:DNA-binding transcriptional ArsR family regulator
MSAAAVPMDAIFRALADPTRLGVLERLGRGPASVGELARPFGMALPSFLQHLRVLEESRLVASRKEGRVRTYRLARGSFGRAETWLSRRRAHWERRLDRLDAYLAVMEEEPT